MVTKKWGGNLSDLLFGLIYLGTLENAVSFGRGFEFRLGLLQYTKPAAIVILISYSKY
jgi:hypothetical protein